MKIDAKTEIGWQIEGADDLMFGAGAAPAEKWLAYLGGIASGVFCIYLYLRGDSGWTFWQFLVGILIAMDIGAGMVANSLNSCKRTYHTAAASHDGRFTRLLKNPLFFTALHIYPILLWLVFDPSRWYDGVFWYLLLVLSAWILLRMPLYLHRPAAVLIVLIVLLVNTALIPAIPGLGWIMPALFLKIILGHLVREEPYRPISIQDQ